ncbi:MAG: hypothetical protein GY861_12770 [bacterium]|nr:hypothetical protein [bacterium]
MSLKETFESMPTHTTCEFIFNGEYQMIYVPWIEKGRGFGEYYFTMGENRKIVIANECDSRETIKNVMDDLIDNNPEDIKKMFHQMIDMCESTDGWE